MAKCYQGCPVYRQFVGARNDQLAVRAAASAQTAARNVFYEGPCPAADPNDQTNMDDPLCNGICGNLCSGVCGSCGNVICPGTPDPAVFAFFASAGRLCLCAGAAVPFNDSAFGIGPVELDDGTITIGQAGRYLVVVTLTGIARTNINSTLALWKNDSAIAGGALDVIAMQGDTLELIGQSVFSAQEGDALRLVTTGALSVYGMPAVTLTLVRIA